MAWAGPAAFYQTRWSERNKWYKARITMPEHVPELYVIEPTDYYQTLAERLQGEIGNLSVDIGFNRRQRQIKKPDLTEEEMERKARRNELFIDIDSLDDDSTMISRHFNVFSDLFGKGVYFHNVQDVKINYDDQNSVKFGNIVGSNLSVNQPTVSIESGKGGFTSMVMLNLEGGISEPKQEDLVLGTPQIIHWLVTNIEDSKDFNSGDQAIPYLQPIPFHGTGFNRIAFVFFRHKEPINVDSFKVKSDQLFDRLFHLKKFVKHLEKIVTPSALRFCQMDWDESCDQALAKLGMKSPRFWYDWNEPLKPPQKEFPMKPMPFDEYLDMYRNPKEVERTLYREWLDELVHKGQVEKPKYPDIFYAENKKRMPVWIHRRYMEKNTGSGIYEKFYSEFLNPAFQSRAQT